MTAQSSSTMPPPTSAAWRSCAGATPIGPNARCARRSACRPTEALEQQVIDVIAVDLPELLAGIDGREVTMLDGEVVLATAGARSNGSRPTGATGFSP